MRFFSRSVAFAGISNNDSSLVKNVVLYVKTSDNQWTKLNTTYDFSNNCWIAIGKFTSGALPVNVSVDYYTITPAIIDRNYLDGFVDSHTNIQVNYLDEVSYINSLFSTGDEETIDAYMNSIGYTNDFFNEYIKNTKV